MIDHLTILGTSHNITAVEHLGAKIIAEKRTSMVTSFPHPSETANHDISVYLDPPHMVKLLRTTLADYKEFHWPGKGTVR